MPTATFPKFCWTFVRINPSMFRPNLKSVASSVPDIIVIGVLVGLANP